MPQPHNPKLRSRLQKNLRAKQKKATKQRQAKTFFIFSKRGFFPQG
jgi:hypothetical protein